MLVDFALFLYHAALMVKSDLRRHAKVSIVIPYFIRTTHTHLFLFVLGTFVTIPRPYISLQLFFVKRSWGKAVNIY